MKIFEKKTHILWKRPEPYLYSRISLSLPWQLHRWSPDSSNIDNPEKRFWLSDLDLWLMTLTFELDLDILPLDLCVSIQVCMSVRLARIVVTHTHGHTHQDFIPSQIFCLSAWFVIISTLARSYIPTLLKVWLNRYSWGAGKLGSQYSSWFRRLECISRRFLTMSI